MKIPVNLRNRQRFLYLFAFWGFYFSACSWLNEIVLLDLKKGKTPQSFINLLKIVKFYKTVQTRCEITKRAARNQNYHINVSIASFSNYLRIANKQSHMNITSALQLFNVTYESHFNS